MHMTQQGNINGRCRQGPTECGRKYMKTLLLILHLLIADFIAPPPSASLQPITTNCFVHSRCRALSLLLLSWEV